MSAAKRVAHAAETIRARWEQDIATDPQTEAAQALEDTCQLLGPEVAEELERLREENPVLRARVVKLEAVVAAERARHTQYEDSPHCQLDGEFWPCRTVATLDARDAADGITRLITPLQALREETADACDACGSLPEEWCPDCAACRKGCHGGNDGNPCAHPNAPWVVKSGVSLEDPHDSPLHREYKVPRDRPEWGGAQ